VLPDVVVEVHVTELELTNAQVVANAPPRSHWNQLPRRKRRRWTENELRCTHLVAVDENGNLALLEDRRHRVAVPAGRSETSGAQTRLPGNLTRDFR